MILVVDQIIIGKTITLFLNLLLAVLKVLHKRRNISQVQNSEE